MKKTLIQLITLTLLLGTAEIVKATSFTFDSVPSAFPRAAQAVFDISGTTLTVTLTNTSTADVLFTNELLTAVFFNINGVGALTPVSALLNIGSTVLSGWPNGGGNVGGEWAYGSGLVGAPGGATEGISSSGFGIFGAGNFPAGATPLTTPPPSLGGGEYAITSAGDNLSTHNSADADPSANPIIKNSVGFTLTGDFTKFTDISNVSFQYGTDLSEPNVPVPEPGILVLLGIALSAVGLASRLFKI
jgi:hypothetical protein